MKTELLAPAKNYEVAIEAINCGADAVYIGASAFGARQNAYNKVEDIKNLVNYAHKFWVKVYVTVNTILTNDEIPQAVKLVKELDSIGVDAILFQDLGLLEKIKDLNLGIPIHASTQCDNRTEKKVRWLKEIGCSRVVLARELSLEQIQEIHKANPDIELEAFVHGALCVSYSGQCYLSHYIGGRSANRGECAQPCRKKYDVVTEDGEIIAKSIYALCLKDFNASNRIKDMINAGIYSFKIEGRLKDSGYVKNVVSYYRQELDKYSQKSSSGKSFLDFIPNLEKSFNRGFTEYFLTGRNNCYSFDSPKSRGEYIGKVTSAKEDYIVINTKKHLNVQDGLFFSDGGFSINKISGEKIYINKSIKIKIGTPIYRNNDIEFNKKVAMPVKRKIGITIVFNDKICIIDEDGIKVELDIQHSEPAKNKEKMNETFIKQFSKTGESDFYIEDIKILSDIPFIPVSEINALRRKAFDILMNNRIKAYKREKPKKIKYSDYFTQEVDYRANVMNNYAYNFYKKCNCNVNEFAMESCIPKHKIELMRTKHCIKFALNMCQSPKNLFLVDEKNKKYPLKFDCHECEMCVLN